MRIALFYPDSIYCAWSLGPGLANSLKSLGHSVLSYPVGRKGPNVELSACDAIIVSGPEHIDLQLQSLFPRWHSLEIPKVGWFVETVEREDYGRQPIERILKLCDATFCAGIQDEKYGMTWLPFGADETQFWSNDNAGSKKYDAAFIGMTYGKRQAFLQKLASHLSGVSFTLGSVSVQDLSGLRVQETVELYSQNIRETKVFVNLPHLSQLAVTKVWEVAACGTFLLTPRVPDMKNFADLPVEFYAPENPKELADQIRYWLKHDDEREERAKLLSLSMKEHSNVKRAEILMNAVVRLTAGKCVSQ